jgi:SAM-dependent methyltransferase/diadenosine tetraphosphate (Ap4A) HIT family hydrolase
MSHALLRTIKAYNESAEMFSDQWFSNTDLHPLLKRVTAILPPGARILDAGCGSGRDVEYLGQLGFDCLGVDLSSGMIREARRRSPKSVFRLMDIRSIDLPPELFDCVISLAVIVHLDLTDVTAVFAEAQRLLRPNGILALTFNLGEGQDICTRGRQRFYHSRRDILLLLENASFKVELVEEEFKPAGSGRSGGQTWCHVVCRKDAISNVIETPDCSFCSSSFLPENTIAKLPRVGSVLWGNDKLWVTLDVAPARQGHCLIVTRDHVLSTVDSPIEDAELERCKERISLLMAQAFRTTPTFIEHGTSRPAISGTCVEHAHIHALPIGPDDVEQIRAHFSNYATKSLTEFRKAAAAGEYLSVSQNARESWFYTVDIAPLRSQIFRSILAAEDTTKSTWTAVRGTPEGNAAFNEAFERYIEFLDVEAENRLGLVE